MNLIVSRTPKGTRQYPIHKHSHYEISYCIGKKGILKTAEKNFVFSEGSIIVVPPGIAHSSSSEQCLDSIYIRGDFGILLNVNEPIILQDNLNGDGKLLATLIYNNRFSNKEYLASLCDAYVHFIATNMKLEDSIGRAVSDIVYKITKHSLKPNISIAQILNESGYSPDYIRCEFRKITGKTPVAFLTDIRMRQACFLMETFASTIALSQIAENCGYTDYVYFSKKFKSFTGLSPTEYKNRCGTL